MQGTQKCSACRTHTPSHAVFHIGTQVSARSHSRNNRTSHFCLASLRTGKPQRQVVLFLRDQETIYHQNSSPELIYHVPFFVKLASFDIVTPSAVRFVLTNLRSEESDFAKQCSTGYKNQKPVQQTLFLCNTARTHPTRPRRHLSSRSLGNRHPHCG